MPQRLAKKLLIIGWDAADWKFIGQLLAKDLMPEFRRLMQRGIHADLSTLEPKLSPLLWTSIATGKTADKHGILNFVEPNPNAGNLRVSASTTRKTKALWNIFTQAGLRTNVVSWYASHPAEPIRGTCVTNLFQEGAPQSSREPWPITDSSVHPSDLASTIAKQRLHPAQVAESMLQQMVARMGKVSADDARIRTLKKLVAQCHSVHRAALAVLSKDTAWDCTMVFYDSIDTIGHHFMEFHPPRMAHVSQKDFDSFHDVMTGVYRLHDLLLGQLLKAAGDDVTVILLSDHGFFCDELRPKPMEINGVERAAVEAAWHRQFGVLLMAGPGVRNQGERIAGASILDIAPTALALLGLPIGQDMDGRVLLPAFDRQVPMESVASWDSVSGEAGMHPVELRQDPFDSHDALKQLVDLGYIAALSDDMQKLLELAKRETQFNLAMVYLTTDRPGLAEPVFAELAAQHPNESRYVMGWARCLYALMKWTACTDVLGAYLLQNPENLDARFLLAAALGLGGRRQQAMHELESLESAVTGSNRRGLRVPLGDAYSIMHMWSDAERQYREALSTDPRNPHVLQGLAQSLLAQRRFDDAVDSLLTALEIQHMLPQSHYLLGVALTWLEDFPHAIQSFRTALSMQPGLVDAHLYLSLACRQMNDTDGGNAHALSARQLAAKAEAVNRAQEAPMGPSEWAREKGIALEGLGVPA